MFFNITLGVHKANEENSKVIYREAVRSVTIKNGKFLMIRTIKGDFKFPGGGPRNGESLEEALIREVREETGFIIERVKRRIGMVTERKPDKYVKDAMFEMISHYYLCDISENYGAQELDDYEKALDFRPHWVDIDDAIENNENLLRGNNDINPWVQRETAVLYKMRDLLGRLAADL
ncbi:MAG TPA: NUDIX domain-containing protein [Clostridiaceae bacterium]|nr:NUDIX domain-containing protein [Clostridiaceae bacterium]